MVNSVLLSLQLQLAAGTVAAADVLAQVNAPVVDHRGHKETSLSSKNSWLNFLCFGRSPTCTHINTRHTQCNARTQVPQILKRHFDIAALLVLGTQVLNSRREWDEEERRSEREREK